MSIVSSSVVPQASAQSVDSILLSLTRYQHIHPHWSIGRALGQLTATDGLCPNAAQLTLEWLKLDRNQLIGRMRRTELAQLAQSICRRIQSCCGC